MRPKEVPLLAAVVPAMLVLGVLFAVAGVLTAASEIGRVLATRRDSAAGIAELQRMLDAPEFAAANVAKPRELPDD